MILIKFILQVVIITIILGIAFLIACLIDWATTVPSAPKIKYKSFKTFYNLNPDRWELHCGYVWCRTINKNGSYGKEIFRFGFIDYIRYYFWMLGAEKRKNEMDNSEAIARMLASVKYDIEKTERQAKKHSNQAIDDLHQIVNNLKRSNS